MASLAELARNLTDLDKTEVDHLQRLVASWGVLADLSFSDVLLFGRVAPVVADVDDAGVVVLAHLRPTTSQTVYWADLVGATIASSHRPYVAAAFAGGAVVEGLLNAPSTEEVIRVTAVPVRCGGRVIAVLTRESAPATERHEGELERAYREVFEKFAVMLAEGAFPFVDEEPGSEEAPRVADGVVVMDAAQRVTFASPNAVSALHRVGVHTNTVGQRLDDVGLDDGAVQRAFALKCPATEEVEAGTDVTVIVRCLPLLAAGEVRGGLVFVRDVTELRRRDRLLQTKDTTIQEIHHRVKNNLQTISSLLRLQARRLESPEAKAAVEESVRRIRTIALVHETLSREAGEDVPFAEILRPLVRMVEEALGSPDRPVGVRVRGDAGKLPAAVATPVAVVLTELIHNAMEHAFGAPGTVGGTVVLDLANDGACFAVEVIDDGVGVPNGFTLEASSGLGLSIVRTLVEGELGGTIALRNGDADGSQLKGTVVSVRVPLTDHVAPDATRPPEAGGRG